MVDARILNHPLSPIAKRTAIALFAIVCIMAIGTIGIKLLSPGWHWIDSFYFMAMLGTAEGPAATPPTFWGKIFAGLMAFVSIGTLITAAGIIFGPALGYLFHKGWIFAEEIKKREDERASKEKM
jgi:hypothetical protein